MSALTSRYARAFVDVVLGERLDVNKTVEEVHAMAATAQSSLELRRVWESPAISAEQKRALLDAIVKREGTSRPVRNFIAVLIDHRRINLLDQVIKDFEQELNQRLGFTEADITSARDLSRSEERRVGKE